MDIDNRESRGLGTRLHVTNIAPKALVNFSKECMDPSSRLSNHLMATRPRLEGKTVHIRAFIFGMDSHSLIKVTNMFNRIGPTIINGKGRLVAATRELNLFNTPRKKGVGYLKETFPMESCPWLLLGGVLDLLQYCFRPEV